MLFRSTDMDQYVLANGDLVWGGDITVNGVERRAYQDPNDPTQITSLPADVTRLTDNKEGTSKITKTEMTLASISLADDNRYSEDLDAVGRKKANIFFAAVYIDMINRENTTKEQAEARARERTLARIKDGEFQQTEVTTTEKAHPGVSQAIWDKMSQKDRDAFLAAANEGG